eukprot:GFUD01005025.1.p1 GENE.GFUD01005025.1~~GFUD01005025.1.p1  ORF type:complete len:197 (+),score=98.13 GFUD01005025.1:81-671(+)
MAAKDDEEMGLNGVTEDMMREIQLLQLQEKRMRKLVDQRKEERKTLEVENSRMQRQKKYMEEMAQENVDWEEEYSRQMAAKGPFAGVGNMLGAPSPAPAAAPLPSRPARQVQPVAVDSSQPVGSVQVRLGDGSRIVVKLNHHHTVRDVKQEIQARQPEEGREFSLVSMGPPSKVLQDSLGLKEGDLIGSAVMQRFA